MLKEQNPILSVVIPLYNKENEIKRAVTSVLSQTFEGFELIIVNDGSTDDSRKVAEGIADNRIRIIDQKNAGVSSARNRGVREARSELIAFLDADDAWKPTFLDKILHLKDKYSSCGIFATNYLYHELNGKYRLPKINGLPDNRWEGIITNYFEIAAKSDPPICSSAVCVVKNALTSVGGFPLGVCSGEDLLTWANLALENKIAYSTSPESVIYLKVTAASDPIRVPASNDAVGKALRNMLKKAPPSMEKGVREYIGLWHQMRLSMFLKLGEKKSARIEFLEMKGYSKKNTKYFLFVMLLHLPDKTSTFLIKMISKIKPIYNLLQSSFVNSHD